jgi:hypothetical protein
MSILITVGDLVHEYIEHHPEEYKQYVIAFIKENYNCIQNELFRLRSRYDKDDLSQYDLLIDNTTEELGDRALDQLIFRVDNIREVSPALGYMHVCKLCQFINEHSR